MRENGAKKRRRRHSPELKVRVALEAIRERKTINEIASESGIHPTQVSSWKREAIEGLAKVLGQGAAEDMRRREELESGLYEEVYLHDYDSLTQAWQGLDRYFRFYNHERPHQGLEDYPPAAVYFN